MTKRTDIKRGLLGKATCGRCGASLDKSWDRCPYCPEPAERPEGGWLVILRGASAGLLVPLGRLTAIGVDSSCDLRLDDPYLSSLHTEIGRSGGRWLLRDMDSTNGTYLNQQRVSGAELCDGDVLQIGHVVAVFKSLEKRRGGAVVDARALAGVEVPTVAWLVPCAGPEAGTTLRFAGPSSHLGGAQEADLRFRDDFISSFHAEIRLQAARFTLRDLRSTNGTFVNDEQISFTDLVDGDVIRVGRTELVFKVV